MIAALPMYDFDDLQQANDCLWALLREDLRAQGIAAPDHLTRDADLWQIWRDPGLVLAQTCGYPFRARLHASVGLVGTPDYGVEGCGPGEYCSVIIARKDDPRDHIAAFDGVPMAYNDALSQSGWAAPQNVAAGLGLRFPPGLLTGAHRETLRAVAEGRAAFGALDAVTWRHLQRLDPTAQTVRVIARTPPTPGLPIITAPTQDPDRILDSMRRAIAALPAAPKDVLGLRGIVRIPAERYLAVPNPASPDQFAQN